MRIKILFLVLIVVMVAGTSFAGKPRGHDAAATQLVDEVLVVAKDNKITPVTMYIEYTYLGWEKAFVVDAKSNSYEITQDRKAMNDASSKINSFMKTCKKDKECYEGMNIRGVKVYRQHG